MKYFTIIIGLLLVVSVSVLGYFVINDRTKPVQPAPQLLSDTPGLKEEIGKLQTENTELKDNLAKQYAFIQKMKEDSLADSARIAKLEKEFHDTMAIIQALLLDKNLAGTDSSAKDKTERPVHLLDPLLNQILSGEIFKDPQFAKVFQEQVAEAVKAFQENERKEETEKFKEQLQQRLAKRIEEFSKTLNLNVYQQQEFTKILSENGNKTIDLFTQFREQKISPEEFGTKREAIRTESNEKVKQVLLPEQFEQYQKAELSLFRGIMPGMGRGGGNNPPRPQEQPQQQNR
ncbi:MAG: hypothetical protein HZA49_10610 [Planctomycetes bacterium]|nr:hypothetical protein [Planctomycetota bacterium]